MAESQADDLLVVGGGVAGYIGALAASRHRPSASIRLLCPATDRFRTHSGVIDVLGYRPGGDGPVTNPLSAIAELPDEHWYTKLGRERLWEALSVFDEAIEGYRGAGTERNALVPTAVGRLKPASRYPAAVASGVASDRRSMRLVGFERLPDLDAAFAADRLSESLPYDVADSSITTSISVGDVPAAPAIAEALDADSETDSGISARESVARELRSTLDVEPRIGVPAVLGVEDAVEIRETVADRLTVEIFEIPLGPPSVPGRRLEARLRSALETAGVAVERGVSVTGTDTDDGRVERVRTEEGTYEASAFVLATGGVQAGGLAGTPSGVREPIFECPVRAPSDRQVWTDAAFLGDHEAVRIGVTVDDRLRPADSAGPQYPNLYAAGRLLETTNVIGEQSTDGIEILTGYEACRRAVEEH